MNKNKKRIENIEDIEIIQKESDKWYFTILYHIIEYLFDPRSVFSSNITNTLSVPQAFAGLSTMASSGVRENIYLNTNTQLSTLNSKLEF